MRVRRREDRAIVLDACGIHRLPLRRQDRVVELLRPAPEVSTYVRRTPGRERRNEFRGNDFSQTDLIDTAFKFGIDISAQRWPQGPEYIRLDRLAERFARARKEIEAWSSESDRRPGVGSLGARALITAGWRCRRASISRDPLGRTISLVAAQPIQARGCAA